MPGTDGAGRTRLSPDVLLRALTPWTRLNGVIGLEINGMLERMGINADVFFESEVDQLVSKEDAPVA
nr:TetR-like C-terminal domain-containing protein [Amycolatopsis pretoriensis]